MEDLDAVRETLNGNTEAFSLLVRRYTPVLFRLASRMSEQSSPDLRAAEAEEAVQEIFLRAYRNLHRFNIRYRFYTWLYSIALNHLRSVRRKRRLSGLITQLPYNDDIHIPGEMPGGRGYASPEERAVEAEGERLAGEALKKLKPREREVFVLRILEEQPVAETARILGIPEGTVKVRLHRARKELAAIMRQWQWEED
jgi:RNA polymerase sigma-70 factor (ECF subfamily)